MATIPPLEQYAPFSSPSPPLSPAPKSSQKSTPPSISTSLVAEHLEQCSDLDLQQLGLLLQKQRVKRKSKLISNYRPGQRIRWVHKKMTFRGEVRRVNKGANKKLVSLTAHQDGQPPDHKWFLRSMEDIEMEDFDESRSSAEHTMASLSMDTCRGCGTLPQTICVACRKFWCFECYKAPTDMCNQCLSDPNVPLIKWDGMGQEAEPRTVGIKGQARQYPCLCDRMSAHPRFLCESAHCIKNKQFESMCHPITGKYQKRPHLPLPLPSISSFCDIPGPHIRGTRMTHHTEDERLRAGCSSQKPLHAAAKTPFMFSEQDSFLSLCFGYTFP